REQLVHLHLRDVYVAQEVAREGLKVIGRFHQPAQNRVGIGLEDPCHGADTETLSPCRDRPHQLVGFHLLAVQRCAMGLQEMSLAAETHQLAPPSAIGMAIGADIPPAHPTVVRTGGLWTEVSGGLDVATAASGEEHAGWRCARGLRLRPDWLRTQRALGL